MHKKLPRQHRWQPPSSVRMPLLDYFLSVGTALMVGLFAVSAYLGPPPATSAAKVSKTATAASILKVEPGPTRRM